MWTLQTAMWTLQTAMWTLQTAMWTLQTAMWTLQTAMWTFVRKNEHCKLQCGHCKLQCVHCTFSSWVKIYSATFRVNLLHDSIVNFTRASKLLGEYFYYNLILQASLVDWDHPFVAASNACVKAKHSGAIHKSHGRKNICTWVKFRHFPFKMKRRFEGSSAGISRQCLEDHGTNPGLIN